MVQRLSLPEECSWITRVLSEGVYDVLGMIRQLGILWFLTFSAADMQWPDVVQSLDNMAPPF